METGWTQKSLIEFEDGIAELFSRGKIMAPIHLSGGNEEQLVRIFSEHVNSCDWILSNWRSHYHCLLKGVPPDQVRQAILAGKSISLCFPEYRVLSSGIAGGTAPIAVGLALGIKRKGEKRKVVVFLGEMSCEMGIVHESIKYAAWHKLPVLFVVEDNGLSVGTPTKSVWGGQSREVSNQANVIRYEYSNTRPHCGVGKWVSF